MMPPVYPVPSGRSAILKYSITPSGFDHSGCDIRMPTKSQVLDAQWQTTHGEIMLWAVVDMEPAAAKVWRRFVIRGTGWQLDDHPGRYVATVQCPDGLVWHVFEVPASSNLKER